MNTKYKHDEKVHNLTSPNEVVPIIMNMFKPNSILDVGCGIGTWMHVFLEHGVSKVEGIDGDYVDKSLLSKHIDIDIFHERDLSEPFDLKSRYDLVLSLEVAEHLPEEAADDFVESLTRHSDVVIFSAAIPGQGGQNHLNEQDFSYWIEKFDSYGYTCFDPLRAKIWNNSKVSYWYKQNMLCFVRKESGKIIPESEILQTIHPKVLKTKIEKLECDLEHVSSGKSGVLNSMHILFKATLNKLGL